MPHCVQLLSLLRDYDVEWPALTLNLLSYSDTFNVGVSIVAPACFIQSWNFYMLYISTIAEPARPATVNGGRPCNLLAASLQRCAQEPLEKVDLFPCMHFWEPTTCVLRRAGHSGIALRWGLACGARQLPVAARSRRDWENAQALWTVSPEDDSREACKDYHLFQEDEGQVHSCCSQTSALASPHD